MMDEQKIERMFRLAEQVVAKCKVSEPVFSANVMGCFERNLVAVLTEGRLRGSLFGAWMPITQEAYNDQELRSTLKSRMQDVWRNQAMGALVPMDLLKGPKGKLPA